MIEFDRTQRGFGIGKFSDRYGEECSIQDSSLATERAIWLGVANPKPQLLVPGKGWATVPLPDGAHISARMHLTVPLARELMILLQRFIDRGTITPDEGEEGSVDLRIKLCEYCDSQYAQDEEGSDPSFCSDDCRKAAVEGE